MHPFDEGYEAEYLGIPQDKNPYPAGSPAAMDWERGWIASAEAPF